MAITLTSNQVEGAGFSQNGQSDAFTTTETLLAAVTGKSIYLTHIAITNGATARIVTIGEGETTDDVTTVIAGPFNMAIKQHIDVQYVRPIKLTAATALTADASGGSVGTNILVEGFVK